MRYEATKRSETILNKLRRLPPKKQAEVLDFVEHLAAQNRRRPAVPAIYSRGARLVKRKRLQSLSLRKIAAIVREVLNVKD